MKYIYIGVLRGEMARMKKQVVKRDIYIYINIGTIKAQP